jgi:steroid 5-alpha reductase family enzyme
LHPIAFALLADIVATLVVFAFSAWYRNASTYDPYWSVIPVLIVLYWALSGQGGGPSCSGRQRWSCWCACGARG